MEKTIVINNDKFIIRPFNEKDENKVLSLWKVAFDKDMPIPIWKWKYIDNPFNQNILLCINKDNLVCVMYGGIPYFANFGGKLIEITQLMDIMSHPDYRKTGLFIHSANAFFDYFGCPERSSILYGFPGKYHFAIGEKYLKYEKIKPSVCYLKLHTSDLLTNQKAQKTKFGFKIKKVNKIDSSFDKLWNNYHTFYPLSVIRDAKFLNWRFMKHPFNKYEIWVYKNFISGNLKAYVILSRKDNKKVSIVDMLFPHDVKIPDNLKDREMTVEKVSIPLYSSDYAWKVEYKVPGQNKVKLGVRLAQEKSGGVLIKSVAENSNAQRAGMKIGDILLSMDGKTLTGVGDILELLQTKHFNDRSTFQLQRGNKTLAVEMVFKKPKI